MAENSNKQVDPTEMINPEVVPYRTVHTGAKIPAVGLGTFGSDRFSGESIAAAVKDAITHGYRHIDCAAVYGNEHLIGESFNDVLANGVVEAARNVAILLVSAVSIAVCSLSTRLGAIFLDLRQRNPSAIVSGFGGTLNLVASLGFMLLAIVPFSVIFHMAVVLELRDVQVRRALGIAYAWLALMLVGTVVVPLWLGLRSLKSRDY